MTFKCIPKILPVLFLCMFYASLALAAVDQKSSSQNTNFPWVVPTNGSPVPALTDITTEYSKGMPADFGGKTNAAVRLLLAAFPDPSIDPNPAAEYFRDLSTFTFYDDKDTRWNLAPLSDKFTMNPLTDIRNVEVLLQYKY